METIEIPKNLNSNKFDNDIIQNQPYKIINENMPLKNNPLNHKNNSLYYSTKKQNKELINNNGNNEDEDLNLNININNYLSKHNINNNQNIKKPKIILKKSKTSETKGYLLPNPYKNINNKMKYISNINNKNEHHDIMKSKLLDRIKKQKGNLKNFDYKLQNINNNSYMINNRKNEGILLIKKEKELEKKDENGNNKNKKKEKEEDKNTPKILTFLKTFKNFALPLRLNNNDKKQNEIMNNNINKKEEKNFLENPNNSCFNFSSKLKPNIAKLNLIKKNIDKQNEEICGGNKDEDEDFIDYNRFTFRNNIVEDDEIRFKNVDKIKIEDKKLYNSIDNYNINNYKDFFDNDISQNINIDEYNKRNKNYNNRKNNDKKIIYHIRSENNFNKIKNKNLNIDELSPDLKQKYIHKNLYKNNFISKPYFRKKYLYNKCDSPKPEPKNLTKNNNIIYTYYNISKQNMRINAQSFNYYDQFDNYNNNDNDDSFQSLNISKRYRKPKLNSFLQRNNNFYNNNVNSYHNDISMDNINLSNNYYSKNQILRNNKIHEIVININDSINSSNNEPNYNTVNNLYSNRSPLKKNVYNINNNTITDNSYYGKYSPLSSKQNGGVFKLSENYDTNQIGYIFGDEEEISNDNIKRKTNYLRFMGSFQKNENKKWYNEDSYYSFDIINMNKSARNKNLLYHKPVRAKIDKNMNKNNSMYIKRIIHYDNKKYYNYLDNDNNNSYNNHKNRFDYIDCDEKENNIFDFDAPKAIKDSFDVISNNSNNSEIVNDSSRENQFSINSDISTNKLNVSVNNNIQNNADNSNVYNKNNNQSLSNRNPKKFVYMKKLNTVYNLYQGTKKLFSKINDKVFKNYKKEEKVQNNQKTVKNKIGKKDDIQNKNYKNIHNHNIKNDNNNYAKNNDLLIYQGEITPRVRVEDNDNNISYFTKNSMGTPYIEENQKNKNIYNKYINKKVINKKNILLKKYYNFYISKINNKNNVSYFSKILSHKAYKIPNLSIYYMTKEKIKIYKVPKNDNKCYFDKINIINNQNINNNLEQRKFFSFFNIGGNYKENLNESNYNVNVLIKGEEENKKIMNLKHNLFINDKQIDLLLTSGDFNKISNIDNIDRNSFSFKDNKILNTNNISNNINNNIAINTFNFTLPPKNAFLNKNITSEKNNILSVINNEENKKYDYKCILSLKNNKLSNNNNLLPKKVLQHFDNLKKEKEMFYIYFKNNNERSKDKKKLNKEEIQELIKKYFTPNKKQVTKKKLNPNFLSENKQNDYLNREKNSKNSERKLNMEWIRNDLSKEIEQAEKYIKELKIKMEINTIKNDNICLLNMLTVDNLNIILIRIIELITRKNNELLSNKEVIDNEYILIKIIVEKAITEKRFVNLYAKLCYELYNILNDKIYNEINFKNILMEECKLKFSELNYINNGNNDNNTNSDNNINLNDEKYFQIKKNFLGIIDFICELINVNILQPEIGFYYLEELFKKYNNYNEIEKFKKNLCLEAIINFLSKFGKKIYQNKNINNFKYLNYFIDNNLSPILEKEKLAGFIKYKIINLIEKQKNKWKDSLYEKSILVKSKKIVNKNNDSISVNNTHKLRKRRHSNKNLKNISPNKFITNYNPNINYNNGNNIYKNNINRDSISYISASNINTNNNNEEIIILIENDLKNYEVFLKDNNIMNKLDLEKNNQIGNEYNWSTIEDILSKNNADLGEVIRCYVEVCIDLTEDKKKIFIANDYIKNIIYYYSVNLSNKEKDIIHNKMINLYRNIQDICIDNFNMKEIMGYLLFILIENKLNFIKDLNNYIGMDKEIIITIAEVIKYAIISSETKSRKYHNDFKQTKLFVADNIFNDYVTDKIQLSLNQS